MHRPTAVDNHARRGDRQPVAPLAGEDLRAPTKRLRQPDAARIVMAQRTDRHDRQPAFRRVEADIRSIQVKAEGR
jgi:hypothetical protein